MPRSDSLIRPWLARSALLTLTALMTSTTLHAQLPGTVGPMPYEIPENWIEPFAAHGFSWGGNSGIHVESPERIIVLQRGETRLPDPIPPEYTDYPGSLGWNVIRGEHIEWQNILYVINSDGEVLEVWDQWDHLFRGTDGPGPHRLRVSPYDPEQRLWLIDETGHIIYVLSNDGNELLMTLGEKNVSGDGPNHFGQPQDVAFMPDGTVLIADGLQNTRVVMRSADGHYLSEFGVRGDGPGEFATVHGLAFGPGGDLYVVDRNNENIQVFRHVNRGTPGAIPEFEHKATWRGHVNFPLDIIVSEQYVWVTDIRPPKIVQFDHDGNQVYTWLLPDQGPTRWLEMHSFAVDENGNVYGTDNQYGRTQKLVPLSDANPEHLIRPQYVPR